MARLCNHHWVLLKRKNATVTLVYSERIKPNPPIGQEQSNTMDLHQKTKSMLAGMFVPQLDTRDKTVSVQSEMVKLLLQQPGLIYTSRESGLFVL